MGRVGEKMRKQYKSLSIQIGMILTIVFLIIGIWFTISELRLVQDNAELAASELAHVYSNDEQLIEALRVEESNLEKYVGPSFYTSDRVSYFAIYNTEEMLLASSSIYLASSLCDEGISALDGDNAVCSPRLFER